jgi:hypothetical protein
MRRSARSRAEELFAATQKKDEEALTDKEKSRLEIAEQVAKLRGLRLAKEAADKESAVNVAAKTKKAAPRLPQAHRY